MKFAPKTAEQIKESSGGFPLWPKGTYDFEVFEAADEVSKVGNEMIKLRLTVYNDTGAKLSVFDYLLEAMEAKLAHACDAMGLADKYRAGELEAADFAGKAGQLILYIQKGNNGYPDKNSVADYVKPNGDAWAAPKGKPVGAGVGTDLNDEIPF